VRTEKKVSTYEMENQDGDEQPVDITQAIQRVNDLITVLQQRIREHLNKSTDKYPKLAFENENKLPLITQFDPNIGAGGQYRNGKLYVGKRNFTEGSNDEDILATIYHEYMHYLNWEYGDRYRMENLEEGKVYYQNIPCFEERMLSEAEFFEKAYVLFIYDKINIDYETYVEYPNTYKKLNDEQKKEVDIHIKENNLKPEMTCIPFDYSPSNYFKDEINAHTETLNAHNWNVFKMSEQKLNIYNSEITRYTNLYNKAKIYENNNINSNSHEK
jgi:hypothetical protein